MGDKVIKSKMNHENIGLKEKEKNEEIEDQMRIRIADGDKGCKDVR